MKNPYKNTSNILIEKNVHNIQQFLNENIKNVHLNITFGEIIEYYQYKSFNEGVLQGKYEVSQLLKDLIEVEKPDLDL